MKAKCIGGPSDGELVDIDSSCGGYEVETHMEIITTHYYDRKGDNLIYQRGVRRSRLRGFYQDDPWEEEVIDGK